METHFWVWALLTTMGTPPLISLLERCSPTPRTSGAEGGVRGRRILDRALARRVSRQEPVL